MKGYSLTIPAGTDLKEASKVMRDTMREYDRKITSDELRFAVDGPIQLIPEFSCMRVDGEDKHVFAFCNENARMKNAPDNRMANNIYSRAMALERGLTEDVPVDPQWRLRGNVIVAWGDDEFMNAL